MMKTSIYQQEIIELHAFFVDWFGGRLPQTEAGFQRFKTVMADGMHLISPDGSIQARDDLLAGLWHAYGLRQDDATFRIWIENVSLKHEVIDSALLTYEEWQVIADKTTARLSSVLFRPKPGAPNGLEWLHVHETWLPQ